MYIQRGFLIPAYNFNYFADIIQLDNSKLDGSGIFNFGCEQWTLSFEKNTKFRKYFFEGAFLVFIFELHSGDLNTELVWYSNCQKLSNSQIVLYLNAVWVPD